LDVHTSSGQALIELPRAGLAQAMLSLVKNAFDATDESSRVVVDVSGSGNRIRLVVCDRGRGMSSEVLKRVGEPFFTTKEPGRGLGLGLFLARVFAERHGGTLTVDSKDGTTATLEIPARPSVESLPAASPPHGLTAEPTIPQLGPAARRTT
jgi:two-component system sensor histidine kinase RegB